MAERHPARMQLEAFGWGRLSRAESLDVVRHLLEGCSSCRRLTSHFLILPSPRALAAAASSDPVPSGYPLSEPAESTQPKLEAGDYTAVFARVRRTVSRCQEALAMEQAQAPALLAEVASRPFETQWSLVTGDARFHTWSFCGLLLDSSRQAGCTDPARARELAELGGAVAALLSRDVYGEARINDFAARAWAALGNAELLRSDLDGAERSVARAERLLRIGTGDPLEKAEVLLLKAALRGGQHRLPEAHRLLDRVAAIAQRHGDLHLCGRAWIAKGFFYGLAGLPAEAKPFLLGGLLRADATVEPGQSDRADGPEQPDRILALAAAELLFVQLCGGKLCTLHWTTRAKAARVMKQIRQVR